MHAIHRNGSRPSSKGPAECFSGEVRIDPLFQSVTEVTGGKALGIILTGMGHDGREGARILRNAGGTILAQDEASSVVWGMPGAVAAAGLADEILPLDRIGAAIVQRAKNGM